MIFNSLMVIAHSNEILNTNMEYNLSDGDQLVYRRQELTSNSENYEYLMLNIDNFSTVIDGEWKYAELKANWYEYNEANPIPSKINYTDLSNWSLMQSLSQVIYDDQLSLFDFFWAKPLDLGVQNILTPEIFSNSSFFHKFDELYEDADFITNWSIDVSANSNTGNITWFMYFTVMGYWVKDYEIEVDIRFVYNRANILSSLTETISTIKISDWGASFPDIVTYNYDLVKSSVEEPPVPEDNSIPGFNSQIRIIFLAVIMIVLKSQKKKR